MIAQDSTAESSTHEFDVRLKPTGANSARLQVGRRGIQLNAARSSLRPFGALAGRFLFTSQICSVYREGACVRLEFREDGQYSVLRFWAADASAAARIVGHLPSARAVEVEESVHRLQRARKWYVPHPAAASAIAALAVLAAMVWWVRDRSRESVPHPSVAAAVRVPARKSASAQFSPESAADLNVLREDWERTARASGALEMQFRVALNALQDGSLTPAGFSFGLENWLTPQWLSLQRQLEASAPADARARELERLQIAAAKDWEAALRVYVSGLRERNPETVLHAFRLIGMAEQAERKAQQLIDRSAGDTEPDARTQ